MVSRCFLASRAIENAMGMHYEQKKVKMLRSLVYIPLFKETPNAPTLRIHRRDIRNSNDTKTKPQTPPMH